MKKLYGMIGVSVVLVRALKKILDVINDADYYIDEIVVYSVTWKRHRAMILKVMIRFKSERGRSTLGVESIFFGCFIIVYFFFGRKK